MARPTLKTVERKTTVPRAKVRKAMAVVTGNTKVVGGNPKKEMDKQETGTKKKNG